MMKKTLLLAICCFFSANLFAYEMGLVCHRGGNGRIVFDFDSRALEYQNLLSEEELALAEAKIYYAMGPLGLNMGRAAFHSEVEGSESAGSVRLFTDSFRAGSVYAMFRLELKDSESFFSQEEGSVTSGKLKIWLAEPPSTSMDYSVDGYEPMFEWSIRFAGAVHCELSR